MEKRFGVLPIIKDGRKAIGMITDRDICMAVGMRYESLRRFGRGGHDGSFFTNPDDAIDQAFEAMQEHKFRRLPLINAERTFSSLRFTVARDKRPELREQMD